MAPALSLVTHDPASDWSKSFNTEFSLVDNVNFSTVHMTWEPEKQFSFHWNSIVTFNTHSRMLQVFTGCLQGLGLFGMTDMDNTAPIIRIFFVLY